MSTVVKTTCLTKKYPKKVAADKVSMNIEQGDIYGFIGKNGAGKTTTMKMILGLTNPTEGEIELFESRNLNQQRHRIGALIEAPGLYRNHTAYENLKRLSILYGGDDKEIKDILEIVGLADTGSKKTKDFSLGMKQRLGIGMALLGSPELLVLDEPINGLDPEGIKDIRDTIIRLNTERNVTFLISSHILDELSKITTRYGIINNGVLCEEISAKDLNDRCRKNLVLRVSDVNKALDLLQGKFITSDDDKFEVKDQSIVLYKDFDQSAQINKLLVENGVDVYELFANAEDFEDYFIERIGK